MKRSSIIIDGRKIAANIIAEVERDLTDLKKKNIIPGLAVIIVGTNPASQIYVNRKREMAAKIGINSFVFAIDENASTNDVIEKIRQLNKDHNVHGVLVQLPLPDHVDTKAVINAIDPKKDVDGFTIENTGKLTLNQDGLAPCTPQGCLDLIKSVTPNIRGLNAVVIGRSNIVGRPMASILMHEDCTVTVVHSKTQNPEKITREADIIVAAAGVPKLVKKDWLKDGCIVIDVGISRIKEHGKEILVGDVDFEAALGIAKAITPVPGGVGPMTISYLLKNTLKAVYHSL